MYSSTYTPQQRYVGMYVCETGEGGHRKIMQSSAKIYRGKWVVIEERIAFFFGRYDI